MSQVKRQFTTQMYQVTYSVTGETHDMRLDQFLQLHFESFSRQQVKTKISAGDISIINRNHKMKPSTRIKEGETVVIKTYAKDEVIEQWRGKDIQRVTDVEVVFDHEDFVIINKPAFMATHPTGKHLFYCATVMLEAQLKQKVYSVHRLDRETSGVMMLSKNVEHSKVMTPLFENRKVKKTYYLIAHKKKLITFPFTAKERLGTLDDFVPSLFTHCFPEGDVLGKSAQTRFELAWESELFYGVFAYPLTGRQHQIRAHAAFHGLALVGDKLYNGDPQVFTRFKDGEETIEDIQKMIIPRHALHAFKLEVPLEEKVEFSTSLPTFGIDPKFLKDQ